MYCPVRPVKVAMSRAICSGVNAMNWQTTSKERSAERAIGRPPSFMSPAMVSTPAGRPALVWPRLKTVTLWPAATACSTQGSEICPVPPM